DLVTRHHGAHAFGCAGVYQVAGLQVVEAREVFDDFADVPDQLVHIGALFFGAVDAQLQRAALDHGGGHGHDVAAHRAVLDVLAQVPGAAFVARDQLQVAARHVEAGGVAVDELV